MEIKAKRTKKILEVARVYTLAIFRLIANSSDYEKLVWAWEYINGKIPLNV
jgi:hypothetical protein